MSRGGHVRGSAEHVGGTRVRFRWPCGHSEMQDYGKGRIAKRIPEAGLKFLVRYWGRTGGVNLGPCKRCAPKKAALK